jgi:putative nucleotidyltransferase with HDIG domain
MGSAARVYIWTVTAAGLAALAGAVFMLGAGAAPLLLTIAAAALVVEAWGTALYGDSRVSVSFSLVAAAAVLAGFPGGAIVGAGAAAGTLLHRRNFTKFGFNVGVLVISGAAMGATLDFLSATGLPDIQWPLMFLSVALASSVNYLVNSGLVASVIGLTSGKSPVAVWREKHSWLFVHYLALGIIGLGLADGYTLAGPMGVSIFLIPVIMQRVSMEQYVRRTERSVRELQEKNVRLAQSHSKLLSAHTDLSTLTKQLEETCDGTLLALVRALDARDSDTRGHSERVAAHTASLARALCIREGGPEWDTIVRGALLHDVGKIGVTDAILLKPGPLTDAEQIVMREHAQTGFDMLREIPFLAGASEIVLCHHERWDGDGYPRQLQREEIPIGARLFAIADTFDAMMSDRPYRRALSLDETVAEIVRQRGTQFDPDAVGSFLRIYEEWLAQYPAYLAGHRDRAA